MHTLSSWGIVFDIRHFSVHDGPGIRTSVFLKGCPLKCSWCHNPESQQGKIERIIRTDKFNGTLFRHSETIGRKVTDKEIINEIASQIAFFDESKGGVTFSGGEPLAQPRFLKNLLRGCRMLNIHTAIDTSGFAPQSVLHEIAPLTDLFLFDLKLIDEQEHIHHTGVSNRIILENLQYLFRIGADIRLRIPLIPGITDTERNLLAIAEIANNAGNVKGVDLLPYHSMAADKYNRLGISYNLKHLGPYPAEKAEKALHLFTENNISATIGG